jgi:hypothetical protein
MADETIQRTNYVAAPCLLLTRCHWPTDLSSRLGAAALLGPSFPSSHDVCNTHTQAAPLSAQQFPSNLDRGPPPFKALLVISEKPLVPTAFLLSLPCLLLCLIPRIVTIVGFHF